MVAATQPRVAQRALHGREGVLSVAQIGNSRRVLADQVAGQGGDIESRLRQALADASVEASVEPVEPSLEDVFVAATRGAEAAAGTTT